MSKETILFLAANPKKTTQIGVDAELRNIESAIKRGKNRDDFNLVSKLAVSPDDLTNILLNESPTIIHFVMHADNEGLFLSGENNFRQKVSFKSIIDLISKTSPQVKLVYLSICSVKEFANGLSERIPYVIAYDEEVEDKAASIVSGSFYSNLANGLSIRKAIDLAQVQMEMSGIAENKPILYINDDLVQDLEGEKSNNSEEGHLNINYWCIALNDTQWGILGFDSDDPSIYLQIKNEDETKNLERLTKGDRLIGFSQGEQKELVGIFSVPQHQNKNAIGGEQIELALENQFEPYVPVELLNDLESFNNSEPVKDSFSSLLYPISKVEYGNFLKVGRYNRNYDNNLHQVQPKIHSDQWAKIDSLQYRVFAKTMVQLINDENSKPPLTIGIFAPWGQGKTTLMRYLEEYLTKSDLAEGKIKVSSPNSDDSDPQAAQNWWSKLFSKRRAKVSLIPAGQGDNLGQFTFESDPGLIKNWIKGDRFWVKRKKKSPTVWFNPWHYHSTEAIWSGMAHAIIEQLVSTLPKLKQEEFWLKLQLKRIDHGEIRKDIHKFVLTKGIPLFILAFLCLVTMTFLILKSESIFGILSGLGAFSSTFAGWKVRKKQGEDFLKEKYSTYLQTPDYGSKLGSFHHINQDLEKVFDLLVEKENPVVIFIDDLDRCSPKKVAEVIEAMNLMMNAGFRDKCYFILGMDGEMVAAALDVAYEKMHGKLIDREKTLGSIGWYFLDKFIQLPFYIPTINNSQRSQYLQSLFKKIGSTKQISTPESNTEEAQPAIEKDSLNENDHTPTLEIEKESAPKVISIASNQFSFGELQPIEKLFLETKDSPEIETQVAKSSLYLDPSPRSMKRFANLLRFHTTLQLYREKSGESPLPTETLAKYLTINLRWPQLVRWIQWSYERNFNPNYELEEKNDEKAVNLPDENILSSRIPIEKAKILDGVLDSIMLEGRFGQEYKYKLWQSFAQRNKHLTWLNDKSLFRFLHDTYNANATFENGLLHQIW